MSDFAAVAAQLAALPPDVSPYGVLRSSIRSSLWFTFPKSFYDALIVTAVLYAITIIFCVASIIGKLAVSGFWLFKMKHTPRGRLLIPNATLLYSFFALVFATMSEVNAWVNYNVFKHQGDLRLMQHIIGPLWWPIFFAIAVETASLAASCVLKAGTTAPVRIASRAYLAAIATPGRGLALLPAWSVNLFVLALPIAYISSTQPLFARQAREFSKGYDAFLRLDSELATADAAFRPGDAFNFRPAWLEYTSELQQHMERFASYCPLTYKLCVLFLAILLATFIPLAVTHIIRLRRQIGDAERFQRAGTSRSSLDLQFSRLRRTYGVMIGETVVVIFVAALYTGISLLLAVRYQEITTSAYKTSVAQLLSLFAYGLLGPLINGLIAFRTLAPLCSPIFRRWQQARQHRVAGPALVGGISIVTEVERAIDQIDHESAGDELLALLKSSQRTRFQVDEGESTLVPMHSLALDGDSKEKTIDETPPPASPKRFVVPPFRAPPSSPARSVKGV